MFSGVFKGFPRAIIGYDGKSIDTNTQDQTTDLEILRFNKITHSTTLATAVTLFDRTIEVANATGISVGSYLILFNQASGKLMPCVVTDISASPVIGIDRPADYAFPVGTNVDITIVGMNVDGSSGEKVFGIRGPFVPATALNISIDINQIRLFCITAAVPTLTDFGDIVGGLTNGLLIRSRIGGEYKNHLVTKTNAEILGAFGNWTPYIGTNPGIGVNGFVAILHLNGQDNHGVARRLAPGDDLEIVNDSNLLSITLLEAVAVGHVVQD